MDTPTKEKKERKLKKDKKHKHKPPRPTDDTSTSTGASSHLLSTMSSPLTKQVLGSPQYNRLGSQVSHLTDDHSYQSNNDDPRALVDASHIHNDEISISSAHSANHSTNHSSHHDASISQRISMASRRGEERARSVGGGSSVTGEEKKRKKKKRVGTLAEVVKNKAGEMEVVDISLLHQDRDDDSKGSHNHNNDTTKGSIAGEGEEKKKSKKKTKSDASTKSSKSSGSKSKSSKKWESSSLGSQLNPSKYTDMGYLTKSASGKFSKGVGLLRKGKFQMARDKFRAALKARILLYEDISHRALVPGHEILGHVELKLHDWDKATLHFNAAKEICDGHLKLLEEERSGSIALEEEHEMDRVGLERIVERIMVGLSEVEEGRGGGVVVGSEDGMDMDIVDAIVEDLNRYDDFNVGAGKRRSMEFESIAEEEEQEEDAGGGMVVDKLPMMIEEKQEVEAKPKAKSKSGAGKFSEHRLRMTYVSKCQVAEDQYNLRQYEMALSSFQEARNALIQLSTTRTYEGDNPEYEQIRDDINKAFIAERMSDCHVQKFFRTVMYIEKQVNYDNATEELNQIKDSLEKILKRNRGRNDDESLGSYETDHSAILNDLEQLLRTTIQSLGRVYSKQGLWCTKLLRYEMALNFYSKALDVLAELPRVEHKRQSLSSHLGMFKAAADMNEANSIFQTLDGSNDEVSLEQVTKPIYDNTTQKLAMCDDPKALWVAVYMVQCHHFLGTEAFKSDPKAALDHYFSAYRLAVAIQRKQAASNLKSLALNRPQDDLADDNSRDGLKRALTTCGRNLTVLSSAAGFGDTEKSLLQTCGEFKTLECIHIAHALLSTGNSALAFTWIDNGMRDMTDIFATVAKREAEIISYMLSVLTKASPDQSSSKDQLVLNPLALYEGGLPTFTDGYEDKHRVYIYWALEEVTQRLHIDAIYTGDQALEYLKDKEDYIPPTQLDEYFWLIDAQIAILLKENEMRQALEKIKLRIDLLSRHRSDEYHEMAKELIRMACFFSLKDEHSEAKHLLEQALKVVKSMEGGDVRREIDLLQILASTYDALGDIDEAIKFYNISMDLSKKSKREIDDTSKFLLKSCALLNSIGYCYLLSGDTDPALGNIEESLRFQKDIPDEERNQVLYSETLILYGNVLAAQNNLSQAAFYYDSAISDNPNKNPLEPTNLRAWYNKGVTQFRGGDTVGAGHSFGTILDALEDNAGFVSAEVAFVLSAIGSIHFSNRMYDKAIEFFTESLDKTDRQDIQIGMLSNIATTFFMAKKHDKSEKYFLEALKSADLAGREYVDTKCRVMTKLAYVSMKRKLYLKAFELYNEAASLNEPESELAERYESYAEYCRVQLRNQKSENVPLKVRKGIMPETPHFDPLFISFAGGQSASRYRDFVYSPNDKMLTMMGIDPAERDKFPTHAIERKALCDKVLGYLLKRNRFARNEHALEFQQKMIRQLNSKFVYLKRMVDEECSCIPDGAKTSRQGDVVAAMEEPDPDAKRKLLLQQARVGQTTETKIAATKSTPAIDVGTMRLADPEAKRKMLLEQSRVLQKTDGRILVQKTSSRQGIEQDSHSSSKKKMERKGRLGSWSEE